MTHYFVYVSARCVFFFQAEDGIRDDLVTGVQTCALPIWLPSGGRAPGPRAAPARRAPAPPGSSGRCAGSRPVPGPAPNWPRPRHRRAAPAPGRTARPAHLPRAVPARPPGPAGAPAQIPGAWRELRPAAAAAGAAGRTRHADAPGTTHRPAGREIPVPPDRKSVV